MSDLLKHATVYRKANINEYKILLQIDMNKNHWLKLCR